MSVSSPSPLTGVPAHITTLLDRLHALSTDQENSLGQEDFKKNSFDDIMRNKFIALEQDKCHFLYQTCRAINAKNIVEAGTSFGVSTIYLALAVSQNVEATGGSGTVIGTENEPTKAAKAREYWNEAGELVTRHIDLREGNLLETLKSNLPQVDLLLLDIWCPVALPTLKIVQQHMRPGAVVITDNTIGAATSYKDLLEYLRAPDSGFTNLTLPYNKGLELSVYLPQN